MSAMINLVEKQIKEFIEKKRPPQEFREQVDVGYKFKDNTVEIFEIRPAWKDHTTKVTSPIAKVKFIKSKSEWKIYWMLSNMKWLEYEPEFNPKDIKDVLKIIEHDADNCFWG